MKYFILAVSKNHAQLFEVHGDRVLPRGVDGMPASMDDAWAGMERQEKGLQFHGSGPGATGAQAMFHGQGAAKDAVEQEENEYLHKLAKSLHDVLHTEGLPVVFAGVTEEYGMFKKYDKSGMLLEEYIRGNHERTPMEDLKKEADPIVHAHLLKQGEKYIEEYGGLLGTGRTSTDLAAIEEAAENGKVEMLLLTPASEKEAAEAAAYTSAHRGRIVMVGEGKIPEGASVAAILRH